MNEQRLRFRLGLFVVATLIVLTVLVAMFSALPNFFMSIRSALVSVCSLNCEAYTPVDTVVIATRTSY